MPTYITPIDRARAMVAKMGHIKQSDRKQLQTQLNQIADYPERDRPDYFGQSYRNRETRMCLICGGHVVMAIVIDHARKVLYNAGGDFSDY